MPAAVNYIPGKINKTPVGGPIPADAKPGKTVSSSVLGKPGEVTDRRTEKTKTIITEDGRFETQFHNGPIHFKDDQGKWQQIDNNLVPSDKSGFALKNAANKVSVHLPKGLATLRPTQPVPAEELPSKLTVSSETSIQTIHLQ